MTIAEVTVKYVNGPRGRGRSGSIKGTDDVYYGIEWPGMQNDFQPGNTYKIEYEQNGQFKNVKRSRLLAEGAATAPTPGTRQEVSPNTARRMFVGATMHGFANDPANRDPVIVAKTIAAMEDGYDIHYGPARPQSQEQQQPNKVAPKDDMNDEIPF